MPLNIITRSFIAFCLFLLMCSCSNAPSEKPEEAAVQEQQNPKPEKSGFIPGQTVPVEALVVGQHAARQTLPLTGILQPLHAVDIAAEISGKVKKIHKALGDAVTTGETLAVIDDKVPLGHYKQAKSQVLSAKNNLKIARLNLKSDKELLESGDISMLAYENALLAVKTAEANRLSALANLSLLEKNYSDTRIKSPISGFVSRRYIEIGTMVVPNMPVYRVVGLKTLKIEVGVPQASINNVQVGTRAKIILSALNHQTVEGHVRYTSPQADEKTGTFTIEIHVQNTEDLSIRAGMTAKIDLILTDNRNRIVIPDYALVKSNSRDYVYKITDNIARLTEVTVAGSFGAQVIVENGLSEGEKIVVVGMKNLGLETPVWVESIR